MEKRREILLRWRRVENYGYGSLRGVSVKWKREPWEEPNIKVH